MIGAFLSRVLLMVVGYIYPAYGCIRMLEQLDIRQLRFWCRYWIVVAILAIFGDPLLSWVPMYSQAKLALLIYLWCLNTKILPGEWSPPPAMGYHHGSYVAWGFPVRPAPSAPPVRPLPSAPPVPAYPYYPAEHSVFYHIHYMPNHHTPSHHTPSHHTPSHHTPSHQKPQSVTLADVQTAAVTRVVLKLNPRCTCIGCTKKIKKMFSKIRGVYQVTMGEDKERVEVIGTMDVQSMTEYLERKMKRPVQVLT